MGVPRGNAGGCPIIGTTYGVYSIREKQYRCDKKLRSVHIPPTVKVIEKYAFYECSNLAATTLNGVREIGTHAFQFAGLTRVTIPSCVDRIGGYSFNGCESLTSVEMGEGVQSIGDYAFYTCNKLENFTMSSTVEEIGEGAFYSTGLTRVVIPGSVRKIGTYAFNRCVLLETVVLHEGLESIGDGAFQQAPLKTLTIPSTVVSIPNNPFNGCCYLTLRSNNERFVVTDRGELVDVEEGRLFAYLYSNRAEEYIVPGYVRTIGWWAAANNHQLKTVRLHKGIEDVEEHAFDNCTSLTSFIIPEGVRRLSGGRVLEDTENLTSLEIPHSLWANKGIGPETLVGSSIASVCYIIHNEGEREQLRGRAVGGKEVEITFRLEGQ